MNHIGFTGTRHGMTEAQKVAVTEIVRAEVRADLTVAHHGDCRGADADFHAIARAEGLAVVGHIPSINTDRAFCQFDKEHAPLPYMKRNAQIVAASDLMIATPPTMEELSYGGTWRTIGLARKAGKPLAIVLPDGAVRWERRP